MYICTRQGNGGACRRGLERENKDLDRLDDPPPTTTIIDISIREKYEKEQY
jgi:hypothetical protein